MAAYYHYNHENSTPQISDHANLHTLILMNNPNSYGHDHQQQQQQQQQQLSSNNILLLNSAAAAASYSQPPPPFPHHQFVRDNNNNITLYGYPQEEARDISRARQGLSLTLSSQNQGVAQGEVGGGDGGSGGQVSVLGSKYLRAAQELLEEVVNVGDTLTITTTTTTRNNTDDHSPKKGKGVGGETPSDERDNHGNGGGGSGSVQLTTSERQEIQMKKAKLVTMLDEAEQRYRQYNNQMQIVIESFERAAGMGSAKTYTALALKTISKQFRCLKDAIQGQIRAANKSLGEDEGGTGSLAGKIEVSRLKFIDHQIRQQRALQQLGMIQNHNAWRPQRGLPERSVSVLRAWLFEHFLHPYPKDSDKILLAKQTGLTRSQVSNWFINARVRLWKPMIEEMYNEELKEQEQNGSDDKTSSKENSNDDDAIAASNSITEQEKMSVIAAETQAAKDAVSNSCSSFMSIPTTSATPYKGNGITIPPHHNQGFLEMEGISQGSPKRQRSNNDVLNNGEIMIKFGNEKEERENGYPIISGGMNFIGGGGGGGGELGSYGNMGDLGRFETEDFHATRFLQGNGNGGISLSLGLPPSCENHHQQFNNLSAATNNHTFISPNHQNIHHHQFRRGNDFGSISSPSSQHSSAAAFECIDIQNRKGFAARLLPDFVA